MVQVRQFRYEEAPRCALRRVLLSLGELWQLWRCLSRYERFFEVLFGSLGSTRRSTVRLASVRQFRLVQAARCPVRYCMAVAASCVSVGSGQVARRMTRYCKAVEARPVGPGGARPVSGQVRQSRWRTLGWGYSRWRLLRSGRVCQLRNGTVWWRGVRVSLGTASYKLYIPRR